MVRSFIFQRFIVRIVLPLLTGLLAFTTWARDPDAPINQPEQFTELGKTTFATVFVDQKSVQLGNDANGNQVIGMLLRIELNTPIQEPDTTTPTVTIINGSSFSCDQEAAAIVGAASIDKNGAVIKNSVTPLLVRWVRGADTITNLVMSKLCKLPVRAALVV